MPAGQEVLQGAQLPAPAAEKEPTQGVQLFAVPTVEAWLAAPHT